MKRTNYHQMQVAKGTTRLQTTHLSSMTQRKPNYIGREATTKVSIVSSPISNGPSLKKRGKSHKIVDWFGRSIGGSQLGFVLCFSLFSWIERILDRRCQITCWTTSDFPRTITITDKLYFTFPFFLRKFHLNLYLRNLDQINGTLPDNCFNY
jgi:hypothetical protein